MKNSFLNKIKVVGVIEDINLDAEQNYDIIKRKDIKCQKSLWNNKLCVYGKTSNTCKKNNCKRYLDKKYKISTVKVKEVEKGDFVLIPFSKKVNRNSLITNKYEAQYAGHLVSDGWVVNTKKTKICAICMTIDEKKYLEETLEFIYDKFKAKLQYNKGASSTVLVARTGNKKMHDYSSQLVTGKGSDKKYTKEVMFLKPFLQKYLLGAYIQSDGTWNKVNKNIEITTYSPYLANQLLIMFYRCKILASGNRQKISKSAFKSNNDFRYIINVASSECEKINKYVPGKCNNVICKKNRSSKRFFWKNNVVSPISYNIKVD